MTQPQWNKREIDLTSANSDLRVTIDAPVFYVVQLDAPATAKTDLQGDAVPLQARPYCAVDADQWGELYISNEAATPSDAKLILVWGSGFSMGPSASRAREIVEQFQSAGTGGFAPSRLAGDLAPGSTIADGEEASEVLSSAGREKIRLRAQVSGISSTTDRHLVGRDGAVFLDSYTDAAGEPRVVTVDGGGQTIRVYDATDPADLVLLGSLTGALGESFVAVRADGQGKALVLVNDGAAVETHLGVYDISDPTAIALDGSVQVDGNETTGARPYGLSVDVDESLVAFSYDNSEEKSLALVEYSTPASPSLVEVIDSATQAHNGGRMDTDRGVYHATFGASSTLLVRSYRYSANGFTFLQDTTVTSQWSTKTGHVRIDPDRDLLIVGAPGRPTVYATVEIENPEHLSVGAFFQGPGNITTEVNGQRFDVALDLDRDLLFGFPVEGFGGASDLYVQVVDVADYQGPSLVAEVKLEDGSATGAISADWHPETGGVLHLQINDDVLADIVTELGRDRVSLYPLLTDGSRAGEPVQQATLEDGREALVEAEVVGEAEYEVVLEARSGETATVDFVEQSSR